MDKKKAYRELTRYGQRAVQWKAPYRFVYMNALKNRFLTAGNNNNNISDQQLKNTIQFVKNAAEYNGMELQILRAMIHVEYSKNQHKRKIIAKVDRKNVLHHAAFRNYDDTVAALNTTMNLAL